MRSSVILKREVCDTVIHCLSRKQIRLRFRWCECSFQVDFAYTCISEMFLQSSKMVSQQAVNLLSAQSAYFEKLKNLQEGTQGAASPSTAISSSTTTVSTTSGLLGTQLAPDEPISCPVAGSENDNV